MVAVHLKRAIRNIVERETLLCKIEAEQRTVKILNALGHALSAQTNRSTLMNTILTHAREVLHADGGSIYLVDGEKIRFIASQNDTIPYRASRLELSRQGGSPAGHVINTGELINIPDAYLLPDTAPYQLNFNFDRETGYKTISLLIVPIINRDNEVMGAIMFVNKKASPGQPIVTFDQVEPFSDFDADLASSIASQAAVALENYQLFSDITGLFEGFVEASVNAIEARDPTTGGHSHRVAALTTRLARAVNDTSDGPFSGIHFSKMAMKELHYASMLHDFGKVGVREQVLLKAQRLYDWEMNRVEGRFRIAAIQVLMEGISKSGSPAKAGRTFHDLRRDLAVVRKINRPNTKVGPVEIDELERIIAQWRLYDTDEPLLQSQELQRLCTPIGSLDPSERREIELHVTHTWKFLKTIPWTKGLTQVPNIAYAHHEKLDGSGYPRGLVAPEIPFGAKLMSIADIFDALTAGDRPYKAGIPIDRALQIIRSEADAGKLVHDAVELFVVKELWKR